MIKSERNGYILEYDEGKHLYLLNDKPLVGVTTAIGQGYPKSQSLVDWQIREGAKWLYEQFMQVDEASIEQIGNWIKESPKAHKEALEEAGDIGTIVHDFAYHYEAKKSYNLREVIKASKLAQKARKAVFTALRQFRDWSSMNKDEIIALEELICSPSLGYAGRFDRLANREGVITLSDYKTSSSFYITQFVQLAGYSMAIEEWLGIHVDDIEIIRFDKKTGKLSTRNLEQVAKTFGIKPKTMMNKLKGQFETCLETYRFKQKYDKYIRR